MFAVSGLLFVVWCLLLGVCVDCCFVSRVMRAVSSVVCCLLFGVCLLPGVRCVLLVVCYLQCAVCGSLCGVRCMSLVACCVLCAVCRLLFAVFSLLFIV